MINFILLIRLYLFEETDNLLIQLFRSIIVGVISFVIDALIFVFFTESGMYYLYSAVFAFLISLFVHYRLTTSYVFRKTKISKKYEISGYLVIAVIGLFLTEGLLFLLTEYFHIYYIASKFIAAAVVLLWTFTARKFLLYNYK